MKSLIKNTKWLIVLFFLLAALLVLRFLLLFGVIEMPYNTAEDYEYDTTLTITCINEGAADAFVLISDNHVTLIDTGLDKKADRLVDFLNEQGVTKIDEMIITHFHKDHVGGADHVLENFKVGKVYTTFRTKESDDISEYLQAMKKKRLKEKVVTKVTTYEADGVTYTIYPPGKMKYNERTTNNSSLVIKVTLGDYSMLFAGDAQEERIDELLQTPDLECTILKVPHHGRYEENSEAFIDYVSPEFAFITSSNSEPEDERVVDALIASGARVFLIKDGNVTITLTAHSLTISH